MSRGGAVPNHGSGYPADSSMKQTRGLRIGAAQGGDRLLVSDYCFWGVDTRVYFTRAKDQEHYDYYFQDHRTESASPMYEVRVEAITGKNMGDARILLREPEKAWFELNNDDGTPLPPFRLLPLATSVRTVHASAAYRAHGPGPHGTLVLHGPSTAGKSIILLELLREGWEFVTDDTLVVRDGHLVLRYCRPIGVRSQALRHLPWLQQHLGKARDFHTQTGVTHAIHPYDLGISPAPEETSWMWTVILRKSDTFAVHRCGESTVRMNLDVDRHLEQAVAAVTEWTGTDSQKSLGGRSDAP